MPLSEKQLHANRANAARSTGPRTPEGKARSAQNARKHTFIPSTFTVVKVEDLDEVGHIKTDLVALYQPVNSEELFALERIALARHALLRCSRLQAGLLSCAVNLAIDDEGNYLTQPGQALCAPVEMTLGQGYNHALADGFLRMARQDREALKLFLRYQAQTERNYRYAIQEFDRLKSLRAELPDELPDELPNEPVLEPEPEPQQPVTTAPNEPISPPENPLPPPAAPPAPPIKAEPLVSATPDRPAGPIAVLSGPLHSDPVPTLCPGGRNG